MVIDDYHIVVSSQVIAGFNLYFDDFIRLDSHDSRFWQRYFEDQRFRTDPFIRSSIRIPATETPRPYSSYVAYAFAINVFLDQPDIFYGYIFPEDKLFAFIKNLNTTENEQVLLVDATGDIIASTTDSSEIRDLVVQTITSYTGRSRITTRGTRVGERINVIGSRLKSYGIYVVSVVPSGDIRKLNNNLLISLIGVCLLLFIGNAFVAVQLSLRFYRPIASMYDLIDNSVTGAARVTGMNDPSRNEMEYIRNNVVGILSRARTIDKAYHDALPYSRERLLELLTSGQLRRMESTQPLQTELGINVERALFLIALFSIDDYLYFREHFPEMDRKIVKYYMANVCERVCGDEAKVFAPSVDRLCVLLVLSREQSIGYARACLRSVQKEIRKTLGHSVSIGIGSIKENIEEISKSYVDAGYALSYRRVGTRAGCIVFGESTKPNFYHDFSVEKRRALVNALEAGDVDTSNDLIEDILRTNIKRDITIYHLRFLISEITNIIIRVTYRHDLHISDIYSSHFDPRPESYVIENPEALLDFFTSSVSALCRRISGAREIKSIDLLKKVKDYVNSFPLKDITLERVADSLNVSYSYLSRYFKQHAGYSFIQYVNDIKIRKAKEMLEATDTHIYDISDQLGFFSVNSFIRMFKKNEGITPGRYRELYSSHPDLQYDSR